MNIPDSILKNFHYYNEYSCPPVQTEFEIQIDSDGYSEQVELLNILLPITPFIDNFYGTKVVNLFIFEGPYANLLSTNVELHYLQKCIDDYIKYVDQFPFIENHFVIDKKYFDEADNITQEQMASATIFFYELFNLEPKLKDTMFYHGIKDSLEIETILHLIVDRM